MNHPTPTDRWRSLVFAPANRHDLLAKFGRFEADSYVIDLEDAIPVDAKVSVREQLAQAVNSARGTPLAGRLLVRINALGTPWGRDDLAAALSLPVDGIVLPKLESADDMHPVDAAIAATNRSVVTVGGIESMRGVLDVRDAVRGSLSLRAIYFGAEDFATDAGLVRSVAGLEVLYARQRVMLAARSAGIVPIDQAVTAIRDDALFTTDAEQGRGFGYAGKICLTPRQATLSNAVFMPSEAEVERARALLVAVAKQKKLGQGVIAFEGQMVDEPLVERARRLLAMVGDKEYSGV